VPIVMGSTERPQHETFIQVAGKGQRLSAEHLREAMRASATLQQSLLDYAFKFTNQMADTASANSHDFFSTTANAFLDRPGLRRTVADAVSIDNC
jgi:hypothetical protein